jgi:hypothetical protein
MYNNIYGIKDCINEINKDLLSVSNDMCNLKNMFNKRIMTFDSNFEERQKNVKVSNNFSKFKVGRKTK